MNSKNLRTMQDDIKEAKNKLKKPVFGFKKNTPAKEEINNTIKSKENLEQKKNIVEEIPIKKEPALEKDKNKETYNIESVLKNIESKVKSDKDKELTDLTERIGSSIKNNDSTKPIPKKIDKIDKDKEMKDLIERMSKNLEEKQPNTVGNSEKKIEENPKITEDKTPYWEKLHNSIKKEKTEKPIKQKEEVLENNKEDNAPQKNEIADLKKSKSKEEPKTEIPEVIKEEEERTKDGGIIAPKTKEAPIKEAPDKEKKEERELPFFDEEYISPENRLVFGKQEYYSSIRKKIKPKTKEDNIEKFKGIFKEEEPGISEEEEKKMLKRRIVKKYRINLSALPWKKIFIVSFIFLSIWGSLWLYIIPKMREVNEETSEIIAGQSIEEINQKIASQITATKNQVESINYFDGSTSPWNSFYNGNIIRLDIIDDDNGDMLTKDEAMESILGKDNADNIPESFREILTEEYNVIVFKENNSVRLGLVFKFNSDESLLEEIMYNWENTNTKKNRIYNVMKALFVDSKTEEIGQEFASGTYQNIELRYINLPTSETSMDYFIHENLIFFTTSKTSTSQIIDLIKTS